MPKIQRPSSNFGHTDPQLWGSVPIHVFGDHRHHCLPSRNRLGRNVLTFWLLPDCPIPGNIKSFPQELLSTVAWTGLLPTVPLGWDTP